MKIKNIVRQTVFIDFLFNLILNDQQKEKYSNIV